jgi:lipopolysaccharide/colanic/teichoic acid biosynthesis glycosyltransferase
MRSNPLPTIELGTATTPGLFTTTLPEPSTLAAVVEESILPDYSRAALLAGRFVDLVVSLTLLVFGIVPCLLIALAVKGTSRGPVVFSQKRVGRGGDSFTLYKFRTMRNGTHVDVLADDALRSVYEENGFKLPPDDPRITRIGRLLRKTSIDELPQLVNVLRGEMSIVGIRPVTPEELVRRPSHDQAVYRLLAPGLTGLWQVEGRSSVGKSDRLALDRQYVEQWSVMGDIRLMIRTPLAVLRIDHAH